MERREDLTPHRAISISDIANEIKREGEAGCPKLTGRFSLSVSYEEFEQLISQSAQAVLRRRGVEGDFVIDRHNTPTLRQLYLYTAYDSSFEGNLDKGLMLQGRYGSGKSLLMESYAHLQNFLARRFPAIKTPIITYTSAIDICNYIKKCGVQEYRLRPLIIDDFGREPKSVMEFGNVINPLSELIFARADKAVVTHGTTNLLLETLASKEYYGAMIGDRLRAMFNFIVLDGGSRRR